MKKKEFLNKQQGIILYQIAKRRFQLIDPTNKNTTFVTVLPTDNNEEVFNKINIEREKLLSER